MNTNSKEINKLLDTLDQTIEELAPDDAPQVHCGFVLFELIGDFINYWFYPEA